MRRMLEAGFIVCVCLAACGVLQKQPPLKPSVEDCQKALIQVDVDLHDVIAAIVSLKLEDQAQKVPRHNAEWWDAKVSLMSTTAALASSVGRR